MKKLYTILALLLITSYSFSQAPQSFNYQAVVRDGSGEIQADLSVEVITSILQGYIDGTEVFSETHTVTTNDFGLITLLIGTINPTDFQSIDWSIGPYFLKVIVNGTHLGTTQLLSVPFALYAENADTASAYIEVDPLFGAHVSKTITTSDIISWNTTSSWGDHSIVGYATKDMQNERISNLSNPTDEQDAATKAYVDQLISLLEDNGMVVVDFTANETSITLGNSVEFTDNSVLDANIWQWDFGDGNTSTEQNPIHTYTTEGSFTISLTAGNGLLNSTKTKTDYIFVGDLPYFTDSRDGTEYQTVTIGNQVWMAENLKYLPSVVGSSAGNASYPYYYVYGYEGTIVANAKATANYETYGVLYNWTAAMNGASSSSTNPSGIQGVCPTGWHLPSDAEWTELIDYLGGASVAGGKLKELGTTYWTTPNTGATNETGFSAFPGGARGYYGDFSGITTIGIWWSATEIRTDIMTGGAGYRDMRYNSSEVGRNDYGRELGYSVRCVKD